MSKPILVCGLGQVGFRIATLLRDAHIDVIAITETVRPEWARVLTDRGVTIIYGDARDEQVLLQSGLLEVDALIAATSSDLTNIEIALDAKRHHPELPIVVRMFDSSLAGQLEANLGIRRAMAMSQVAAPAFAAAAFGDHVAAEFELDEHRFVVFEVDIGDDEKTVGAFEREFGVEVLVHKRGGQEGLNPDPDVVMKFGDSIQVLGPARAVQALRPELRPSGPHARSKSRKSLLKVWRQTAPELRTAFLIVVVLTLLSVAVFQAGMGLSLVDAVYFVITTVTTTGYGDITPKDSALWLKLYACFMMILGSATIAVLYSIVTDFIVSHRLQQLVGGQDVPDSGHVIVTGIGDVGFRIVEELERMGARVVAIDKNSAAPHLATIRSRIAIIVGDAREPETLLRAGIDRAVALIAASGDDAVNLSIGLAAEEINPSARTVLRLFDGNFANKVQTALGIDAALSASRTAAPVFVSAALHQGTRAAFVLERKLFTVLDGPGEWTVFAGSEGRFGDQTGEHALHIEVRNLLR